MSNSDSVEVVPFQPELAQHFEALNREWIEKYFVIEDADLLVFANPFEEIVAPGGQVFFAVVNGRVLGTCAVLKLSSDVFELAKMAVSSEARGRGYGDRLIEAAIDYAHGSGAQRLILLSNTLLKPAIALYEKHGFRSVPITDAHNYSRVDIQMELTLE